MLKINKAKMSLLLLSAAFTFQTSLFVATTVSADTVSDTATIDNVLSENLNPIQSRQAYLDTSSFGNKNAWEYKYTAQPYAFFYNSLTKQWKMLQVTSYTDHTINVVFNGWTQTINRWATGQYLR